MDRASAAAAVTAASTGSVGALLALMKPFTIGAKTWTPGELMPFLVVNPGRLDEAVAFNSAWVAYWGAATAEAKKVFDLKEAAYRVARDRWVRDRRAQPGKVTKEVLEEEWRTTPDYLKWWEEQAEAQRAWSSANFVYEAFTRQTTNLTSLSRLYADERASHNAGHPR